jgi:hypothetical protein
VPIGTDTQEWLQMSARVAWILWKTEESRINLIQELKLSEWVRAAPKFREYVRFTLRQLALEGIKIDDNPKLEFINMENEEWRIKSARVAWFFWLHYQRMYAYKNPTRALISWEANSTQFRKYIRLSLKELDMENIRICA